MKSVDTPLASSFRSFWDPLQILFRFFWDPSKIPLRSLWDPFEKLSRWFQVVFQHLFKDSFQKLFWDSIGIDPSFFRDRRTATIHWPFCWDCREGCRYDWPRTAVASWRIAPQASFWATKATRTTSAAPSCAAVAQPTKTWPTPHPTASSSRRQGAAEEADWERSWP